MLDNPLSVPQNDIVCWKYLIASCTVAAAVLGVGVGGGQLLFIPATSVESNRGDDTGRALIEVAAVQASPVAATNAHGYGEAGARSSQDDIDQEMAGLDKAVQHNPRDATAFRNRAKAWEARGEPNLALADYDEATRIAPNDANAFRDRGVLWRRLGALNLALLDLDRAIRFTFADAEIYCDRGMVWNQKGEHDRAIADFSHAIKADPRRACAYIGRGVALLAKGEPARARADIHEAIVIDPSLRNVVVISESNPQKTGGRPDASPGGHDLLRLPNETVPGVAAMINDIVAEFDSATRPSPTSVENIRGDDTGRALIEAAAVQVSPVAATNAQGYREASARASQETPVAAPPNVSAAFASPNDQKRVAAVNSLPGNLDTEEVSKLKLAAARGDAEAQVQLGRIYDEGSDGIPSDPQEAARLYRLSADQGNARGQLYLAFMYETGNGVPKDLQTAVLWYKLAASQGSRAAQSNLADAYERGEGGLRKSACEAKRLRQLAAAQGEPFAQKNLAAMRISGCKS